ncbi:HNH endonuclease [Mesorhizobium sp. ISC11]|uniref:HNH endonuclease n=1 Tax=Mesorhizobium sp. ISC11 TaxID=3076428 RepID=UPI003FA52348
MKNAAKVRSELVEIQGGKCCYCRQPFTETGRKVATLEHKTPKMHRGSNKRSNLAAACLGCNQRRGHQMNVAKQRKLASAAD